MKIIWSDTASADMEDIYDFYFAKSPRVADKIYHSILNEADILISHPNIAAIEPLIKDEEFVFRSLVTKNGLFKIIYFVDDMKIFIYRVWCCRADSRNLK